MARCDRSHPDARNFGLGARDMSRAGLHALREGMQSHSSIATMADRWASFAAWAREAGIRDMRQPAGIGCGIMFHRDEIGPYGARIGERRARIARKSRQSNTIG